MAASVAPRRRERHAEHAGLSRDEAIRRGLHAIVRVRARVYRHGPAANPPAGEFQTYVAASEAERICDEMARIERFGGERILGGKGKGGRPWTGASKRYGTDTHYVCGHARTPENTYGHGSRAKCRVCSLKKIRDWRKRNPDRVREIANANRRRYPEKYAAYRKENRLAHQLYCDLRRLARKDGLWPERRARTPKERSAA